MPRFSFPLKIRKRSFHSKNASCTLLLYHRKHSYLRSQQHQCLRRRSLETREIPSSARFQKRLSR
jgi:hypothetical protein